MRVTWQRLIYFHRSVLLGLIIIFETIRQLIIILLPLLKVRSHYNALEEVVTNTVLRIKDSVYKPYHLFFD